MGYLENNPYNQRKGQTQDSQSFTLGHPHPLYHDQQTNHQRGSSDNLKVI